MKIKLVLFTIIYFLTISTTHSADWSISAYASCEATLGEISSSSGGIKAVNGTAVIRCPLTKISGSNTIDDVYVRMKRSSSTSATPFCTLNNIDSDGSPTHSSYGYASNSTSNQSISIPISTQYTYGYAYVLCVLNTDDIMYGIRYIQ